MKYYSEKTKRLYDKEADLKEAERKFENAEAIKIAKEKAAKEKRAARAKEVEAAFKEADAAKLKANKLLNEFVKDYGYFHTSYSLNDADIEKQVDLDKFTNDFVKQVFSFLGKE